MSRRVPTAARRAATLDEFAKPDLADKDGTCPNDETWCGGPTGEDLPCFECFDPDREYNVGVSE